jgi:hypothetical protein
VENNTKDFPKLRKKKVLLAEGQPRKYTKTQHFPEGEKSSFWNPGMKGSNSPKCYLKKKNPQCLTNKAKEFGLYLVGNWEPQMVVK